MFDNDSFCMAGLRSKTLGLYEKDTGRNITCDIADYPYTLIWSAASEPMPLCCIEPWHSLPAAEADGPSWRKRAAAAILAPGENWQTTLRTTLTVERPESVLGGPPGGPAGAGRGVGGAGAVLGSPFQPRRHGLVGGVRFDAGQAGAGRSV